MEIPIKEIYFPRMVSTIRWLREKDAVLIIFDFKDLLKNRICWVVECPDETPFPPFVKIFFESNNFQSVVSKLVERQTGKKSEVERNHRFKNHLIDLNKELKHQYYD